MSLNLLMQNIRSLEANRVLKGYANYIVTAKNTEIYVMRLRPRHVIKNAAVNNTVSLSQIHGSRKRHQYNRTVYDLNIALYRFSLT